MRAWWIVLVSLFVWLAPPAFAAGDGVQTMSVVEWLNYETSQADMVLIGQVQQTAYPHPQTGRVKALIKVGEVFNGPRLGRTLPIIVKPGYRGGKYTVPTPLVKDQWVLFFLHSEGGQWVAPPVGRIVETPYHGLTFYPSYDIVLQDAAPSMSWNYVLDSLRQIVQTRRQIIDGHLPALREATTKEQRDRIKLSIEWQVREQLGLPVP